MFSRSYIFTENERRRLREWLETHREDNETLQLFTEVRRNFAPIRRDIQLYSDLTIRLKKEGRFMGRVRLRRRSASPSLSEGFGSTPTRNDQNT